MQQEELIVYIRDVFAVSLATKFDVKGYAHWNRPGGMIEAWVLISAPHLPCTCGNLMISTELAETQDEAEEKAAQAALEYICANHNITINDYSYYVLEVVKEKRFNMARQ